MIGVQSEKMKEMLLSRIPNDPRKTMQLASELCIAINQRIEIAVNMRLDDGLTNGAGGVVKYVELYNPPQAEGVVWVKFDHEHVGQKIKQGMKIVSCIYLILMSLGFQWCLQLYSFALADRLMQR